MRFDSLMSIFSRRLIVITVTLLLLLLCSGAWMASGSLLNQLLPQANSSPGPKSSGPSVPWPTMLALADQEAAKIDRDAVFSLGPSVSAEPPGTFDNIAYSGPLTGSLRLGFNYDRPNGGIFSINFEDAAPQNTLSRFTRLSEPSATGASEFNRAFGEDYRRQLSKVGISPREAVSLTWREAQIEAQKSMLKTLRLEPVVMFSHWHVKWTVDYKLKAVTVQVPQGSPMAPTPTMGLPNLGSLFGPNNKPTDFLMGFDVDATTGKITQRYYVMFPRPAPSTTP